MATYDYENRGTGERREIIASMKSPPPEVFTEDGVTWNRVWTAPKIIVHDAGGVRYKSNPLPVSQTLAERDTSQGTPETLHGHEVLKYKDGAYTDKQGAWIIRDKSDARRAEELTGTKRET
jgi:hypothetical protein